MSDFGLAKFNSRASVERSTSRGHAPTYRAPELDLKKTIGRMTDIWAFGCVFMEFITWHIHREIDQVEFFNKRARESISRYDACFHTNTLAGESRAALKPVVATVSFQFV